MCIQAWPAVRHFKTMSAEITCSKSPSLKNKERDLGLLTRIHVSSKLLGLLCRI